MEINWTDLFNAARYDAAIEKLIEDAENDNSEAIELLDAFINFKVVSNENHYQIAKHRLDIERRSKYGQGNI